MGGACLRGHGHHWPVGGSGRLAARRWRQSHLADEPDPAGANARPQLLRAAGDPDAVDDGESEAEPRSVSNSDAVAVRISVALGDGQRFGDPVPIADRDVDAITDRDGNAITVAKRQRETLGLALNQMLTGAADGRTLVKDRQCRSVY
jgi:hypothetical protein